MSRETLASRKPNYTAEDVPQALLDNHRYTFVEDEYWYEDVIANWVEDVEKVGIDVEYASDKRPRVYWDQYFHVQAYMTTGRDAEWEAMFEHEDFSDYPFFKEFARTSDHCTFAWKTTEPWGGTKEFMDALDFDYAGIDVDDPIYEIMQPGLDAEADGVLEHMRDIYRSHISRLETNLREEYEYVTSDEYIAEMICENYPEWIDEYNDIAEAV